MFSRVVEVTGYDEYLVYENYYAICYKGDETALPESRNRFSIMHGI